MDSPSSEGGEAGGGGAALEGVLAPLVTSSATLSVLTVAAVALLLTLQLWRSLSTTLPGPWGLPLLGSLHLLDPKKPHESLRQLARRYGPVFQLRLGGVRAVVMARDDIVRKVFAQEAASGRAPLYLTHGIMKGRGVICAEGEQWREHRRFMVGVMKQLGMRGRGAARPALEALVLRDAVTTAQEMGHPREAVIVDPSRLLLHSIGNSMNRLIFGVSYRQDDPVWLRLQELLDKGTKLVGVTGPLNFLPWLRFLPRYQNMLKFLKENQVKTHKVYQDIIDEFQRTESIEGNGVGKLRKTEVKHYVDGYLREMADRGPGMEGSFTLQQLHYMAADMFGGGTETTHTTMRWLLMDLAQRPADQDLVYKEILRVADGQDFVDMEHLPQLTCTQAFIMESQRMHPVIPFGVPHGATKDLRVEGHEVPKGTMLIPLVAELHNDPEHWTDPTVFSWQRFIDPDTQTLLRRKSFMPFQAGRRVCPGEDYARTVLVLYVTQVLLQYRLQLPRDCSPLHWTAAAAGGHSAFRSSESSLNTGNGHIADDNNINSNLKNDEPILGDKVSSQKESMVTNNEEEWHNPQTKTPEPKRVNSHSLCPKVHEGSREFIQTLQDESQKKHPSVEPICGFTTVPRPFKLLLIPRSHQNAALP